ncbi:aminotransferase class V-fold PLP-dependent enzyme [Patescibacteria group bacterium]|nr:aminotransferase class V-fold PLP-dependent enzyme [Patescibacteria group bacterium]
MKSRQIYLDHAAATPLDPRAKKAMEPFLDDQYGNPSSFHRTGKIVKDALEVARDKAALVVGAIGDEIIFTSGGTESDNLAILGFARANKEHGRHIITVKTEHPAVLQAAKHLEVKEGFEVTYLDVDEDGLVGVEDVLAALRPETILVSVMLANNEIGTIAPVAEIGTAIKKHRSKTSSNFPVLHTDACQAVGSLEVNVQKLGVDLMTVNSSKIYGPKGVGALYVKRGIKLEPLQFGGHQERGWRPGTENVAGIIGFVKALEIAEAERLGYAEKLISLRDYFIGSILTSIPKTRLNGHKDLRLPNNVNISFLDIEGEALLLYLDAAGIEASSGSACTSASLDPSHVILALGLPFEVAHGSIRFSLGRSTTKKDIDFVLAKLPEVVTKLRQLSPVNVDQKYF